MGWMDEMDNPIPELKRLVPEKLSSCWMEGVEELLEGSDEEGGLEGGQGGGRGGLRRVG